MTGVAGAIALAFVAGAAHAEEIKTSASIGAFSDYRLRGISLSNETPVIQGSLDASYKINETFGVFVGAWGSSLDKDAGAAGALEADLYFGATADFGDVDVKATYLRILFPDADPFDTDFDQYALAVNFPVGPVGGTVGVVHDEYKGGLSSTYYYVSGAYAFPDTGFAVKGSLGYEDGDTFKEKTNWGLGASYTYKTLTFGAEYIDTDQELIVAGEDMADSTVVLSITSAF
jgi:uncharacterized protein (TIGR02001 family)